jgi:hypothetical protein
METDTPKRAYPMNTLKLTALSLVVSVIGAVTSPAARDCASDLPSPPNGHRRRRRPSRHGRTRPQTPRRAFRPQLIAFLPHPESGLSWEQVKVAGPSLGMIERVIYVNLLSSVHSDRNSGWAL